MRAFWVGLLVAANAGRAGAEVRRYAVIAGNNVGDAGDNELRYAETDAHRLEEVLQRLGGFRAENTTMVLGRNSEALRRALIATNDRIRTANDAADSLLLVYYSGHADADALHLAASRFALEELRQLVSGSAATVRLLVVDACRSGAAIRGKGGLNEAPFQISVDERLTGAGVVIITAAAAGEDAQESDEIGGSFFTHHLVSGLLGAADHNQDGVVVIDEAYRYAYEQTLRASSRTLAGVQHPSYRYDLHGHGDIVLADLNADRADRGALVLPPALHCLVMHDTADGGVAAEVEAYGNNRRLSLRQGRYFLRARGPKLLLESEMTIRAGQTTTVDVGAMRRTEYGRLARKGHRDSAWGTSGGYWVRSSLQADASACQGIFLGATAELAELSVMPRLGACLGGFANDSLRARTTEINVDVRVSRAWDLRWVTLDGGLLLGGAVLAQQFTTAGKAPSRYGAVLLLGLSAGAAVDLPHGWSLRTEVDGRSYVFNLEHHQQTSLATPLVVAVSVGVGRSF